MISEFFPDHRVSILFVVSSSVHLEFSGHLTKSKQGHALLFGEVVPGFILKHGIQFNFVVVSRVHCEFSVIFTISNKGHVLFYGAVVY